MANLTMNSLTRSDQVDYDDLAARAGFKDRKSANAAWCRVTKKIFPAVGAKSSPAGEEATPAKAKATTARKPAERKGAKAKAADKDDGNGSGDGEKNDSPADPANGEVKTAEGTFSKNEVYEILTSRTCPVVFWASRSRC